MLKTFSTIVVTSGLLLFAQVETTWEKTGAFGIFVTSSGAIIWILWTRLQALQDHVQRTRDAELAELRARNDELEKRLAKEDNEHD